MFKLHSTLSLAPICFILQRKTSLQNREQNVSHESLEARSLSLPSHHFSDQPRLLIHVEENRDNLLRTVPGQHLHRLSEDGCESAREAPAGDKEKNASFLWRGPHLGRRKLPESGVMVVVVLIPYLNQHDMFILVSS